MKKSKGLSNFDFIKVIRSFSKAELNEFDKLLRSSFFNNHSTLIRLFSELKKYHPAYEDKILTKEYLYGIVNNGKIFNDAVFRKYFSRLYKFAEIYLNILEIRRTPFEADLKVLYQLGKRNIEDIFERKLKETDKKFVRNRKINELNCYYLHKFYEIKIYNSSKNNIVKDNINEMIDSITYLFTYFLSVASINSNQIATNSVSFKTTFDNEYLKKIFMNYDIDMYLKELKKYPGNFNKKDILFIEIISCDMKLNSSVENKSVYKKFREIIFENIDIIDDNYLHYLIKRMNVFCIEEHFKNNNEYINDLFENYKFIVEKGLFFLEGVPSLNLLDFRAILFSAARSNEFDWLMNFIKSKKDFFGNIPGDDILNYGMAYLSFYKKEYEKSLDHLSRLSSKQILFTIDAYILKSKIYYEKGYLDSAFSLSDAFRHYLKNNYMISEEFKTGLLNYLKYLKSLINIRNVNDREKHLKIYNSIKENSKVRNKDWLLEKSEELLKKIKMD